MEKLIESLSRLSGNIEKLIENKISINKFNIIKWSGLSGSIWGKVGDNAAFFVIPCMEPDTGNEYYQFTFCWTEVGYKFLDLDAGKLQMEIILDGFLSRSSLEYVSKDTNA